MAAWPITTLIEGAARMTTNSLDRPRDAVTEVASLRVALASLVALLAASALMLGPSRADAASPTTSAAKTRSGAAAIAWRSCGARLDCARVRVPLDWSRARAFRGRTRFAGPTISIAVIRYRASRPKRRIGSLFVNYGGPGVAGVATVRGLGKTLDKLARGRFDIVGWDPRGTGESTHVSCFAGDRARARFWGPDWTVPTTPAESRAYVPKTIQFARRCAARKGRSRAEVPSRPGRGSSAPSARASWSRRSTSGGYGPHAPPGAPAALSATPGRGTPPPRIRSWSSATATTRGRPGPTPASPHGASATPCWLPTTVTATPTRATRAPASMQRSVATSPGSPRHATGPSASPTESRSTPTSARRQTDEAEVNGGAACHNRCDDRGIRHGGSARQRRRSNDAIPPRQRQRRRRHASVRRVGPR